MIAPCCLTTHKQILKDVFALILMQPRRHLARCCHLDHLETCSCVFCQRSQIIAGRRTRSAALRRPSTSCHHRHCRPSRTCCFRRSQTRPRSRSGWLQLGAAPHSCRTPAALESAAAAGSSLIGETASAFVQQWQHVIATATIEAAVTCRSIVGLQNVI